MNAFILLGLFVLLHLCATEHSINTSTKRRKRQIDRNDRKDQHSSKNQKQLLRNVYFDIADNRLLDTDALKKKKAQIARLRQSKYNNDITKKDLVNRLGNFSLQGVRRNINTIGISQRQNVDSPRSVVGKPYGDPDNYQNIGDGIYLMNDEDGAQANHVKKQPAAVAQSESSAVLTEPTGLIESHILKSMDAIKHIDKLGTNFAVENAEQEMQLEHFPTDDEYNHGADIAAHNTMENNNVEFSQHGNIEGVSQSEMKMINTMQGHLNQEDQINGNSQKESVEINPVNERASDYSTTQGAIGNTQDNSDGSNPIKKDTFVRNQSRNKDKTPKKDMLANHEIQKYSEYKNTTYNNKVSHKKEIIETAKGPYYSRSNSRTNNTKYDMETAEKPFKKPLSSRNHTEILTRSSSYPVNSTESSEFDHGSNELVTSRRKNNVLQYYEDTVEKGNSLPAVKRIIIEQDDRQQQAHLNETLNEHSGKLYYYNRKNNQQEDQENKDQEIDGLVKVLNKTDADKFKKQKHKGFVLKQELKPKQKNKSNKIEKEHRRQQQQQNFVQKSQVKIKSSSNEKVIDVTGKKGFQIDLYIDGNKNERVLEQQRDVKSNVQESNDDTIKNSYPFGTTVYTSPNGEISTNGIITAPDAPEQNDNGDSGSATESGDQNVNLAESTVLATKMFSSTANGEKHALDKAVMVNHLQGIEDKATSNELEDAISNDAINSAEIRSAMAESDLKGLSQIKNALDDQDTKNSVEYYDQPNPKPNKAETTLNELSEEFKEAERNIEGYGPSSPVKANSGESSSGNVKIVLHLPDHNQVKSRNKDQKIEKETEKVLSYKKSKDTKNSKDKKAMDAAKLIATFIEKVALKKETATASHNSLDRVDENLSAQLNEDMNYGENKTPSTAEVNLVSQIINSDSFQNYFFSSNSKQKSKLGDAAQKTNIEKIVKDVLKESSSLKTKSNPNPNPEPESIQEKIEKMNKNSDDRDMKIKPLRVGGEGNLKINGGKVLGGNVRGGNILGGIITGGNVLGGNINGGSISGGTFKDGLLVGGDIKNGLVEGGKIQGGQVLGGDIKSGLIDGGIVKGGTIEGGHLVNGTVEGGIFKGGEILGGKLLSGEMDGGILKNGTINGGTLKGGVIESGSLDGGVMLSGILRGGIVKSGKIRGGIIDKGAVVQDTEVGPGVEIEEGFIKGGKITVKDLPRKSPTDDGVKVKKTTQPKTYSSHDDDYRSNIMYHIEVLPRSLESSNPTIRNTTSKQLVPATNDVQAFQRDHVELVNPAKPIIPKSNIKPLHISQVSLYPTARFEEDIRKNLRPKNVSFPLSPSVVKIANPAVDSSNLILINAKAFKNIQTLPAKNKKTLTETSATMFPVIGNRRQLTMNTPEQQQLLFQQQSQQQVEHLQQSMFQQQQQPVAQQSFAGKLQTSSNGMKDSLTEHWELIGASKNTVRGNPGSKLYLSGSGVSFRNGHAILDGVRGYLDAGDYQGECFSDPEACEYGFTIHMTLKVYRDSVESPKRLFILDSGAVATDSRGISVWVTKNKISALIITRDNSWCITKDLGPYVEKWMVLTLAFKKDIGALLYIDCELYDESKDHFTNECEPQCPKCHQTDVATRLMFGRPNKGPHFKVTHMAIGDISLYEKYFNKEEIKLMCGDHESKATVPAGGNPGETQKPPAQGQQEEASLAVPAQNVGQQLQPPSEQQIMALPHPDTINTSASQEEHKPPAVVISYLHSSPEQHAIDYQPSLSDGVPKPGSTVAVVQVIPSISASSLLSAEAIEKSKQATSSLGEDQPTPIANKPPVATTKGEARSAQRLGQVEAHSLPHQQQQQRERLTSHNEHIIKHYMQHNNDDVVDGGQFVYPTPPGISSKSIVRVTEAPTPLVDFATDRRSNLYSRRRLKVRPRTGYSIWSAWSPCSRSCGDGVQTSVRYCQNKDHDCSSEGTPRKYKRCMLKTCKEEERQSLFSFKDDLTATSGDSLKLELNQLKHKR